MAIPPVVYPIVLTAGVFGGLAWLRHVTMAHAAAATPGGVLPTVPQPAATTAQLLQQAQTLLAQAAANPASVNPGDLDNLAARIRTSSQDPTALAIANALTVSAAGARAAQGTRLPTGTTNPVSTDPNATLKSNARQIIASISLALQRRHPGTTVNENPLDQIDVQLNQAIQAAPNDVELPGLLTQVQSLIGQLHQGTPAVPTTVVQTPGTLPTAVAQAVNHALNDPQATAAIVQHVIDQISSSFPGQFPDVIQQLFDRFNALGGTAALTAVIPPLGNVPTTFYAAITSVLTPPPPNPPPGDPTVTSAAVDQLRQQILAANPQIGGSALDTQLILRQQQLKAAGR